MLKSKEKGEVLIESLLVSRNSLGRMGFSDFKGFDFDYLFCTFLHLK